MRVELHPDARAELRSAALWYDEQRPGLSDEFLAEVCQHVVVLAVAHARRQPLYWLTRTNP